MSDKELRTAAEIVDNDGLKFPRPSIGKYSDMEVGDELVKREDAEQHAELVVRELIVWLHDSLNGIDGEIGELDASEVDVPDDIMEQLQWKTQNMREEVQTVGKKLLEEYFESDNQQKDEIGDIE